MTTYFSTKQAAEYVGSKSTHAFLQWARRHGVPHVNYGRHLRFSPDVLDRVLQTMAMRPRQKKASHSNAA